MYYRSPPPRSGRVLGTQPRSAALTYSTIVRGKWCDVYRPCCREPRKAKDRRDSQIHGDVGGVDLRPRTVPSVSTVWMRSVRDRHVTPGRRNECVGKGGVRLALRYHQCLKPGSSFGRCLTTLLTRLFRVVGRTSARSGSVPVVTSASRDRPLHRGLFQNVVITKRLKVKNNDYISLYN